MFGAEPGMASGEPMEITMLRYYKSIFVIEGPETSFEVVKNKIMTRFTRFDGDPTASDAADEISFGIFAADEISPNPEFAIFIFKSSKTADDAREVAEDLRLLIRPTWEEVRLAHIPLKRPNVLRHSCS
jgi:hypothetical protein